MRLVLFVFVSASLYTSWESFADKDCQLEPSLRPLGESAERHASDPAAVVDHSLETHLNETPKPWRQQVKEDFPLRLVRRPPTAAETMPQEYFGFFRRHDPEAPVKGLWARLGYATQLIPRGLSYVLQGGPIRRVPNTYELHWAEGLSHTLNRIMLRMSRNRPTQSVLSNPIKFMIVGGVGWFGWDRYFSINHSIQDRQRRDAYLETLNNDPRYEDLKPLYESTADPDKARIIAWISSPIAQQLTILLTDLNLSFGANDDAHTLVETLETFVSNFEEPTLQKFNALIEELRRFANKTGQERFQNYVETLEKLVPTYPEIMKQVEEMATNREKMLLALVSMRESQLIVFMNYMNTTYNSQSNEEHYETLITSPFFNTVKRAIKKGRGTSTPAITVDPHLPKIFSDDEKIALIETQIDRYLLWNWIPGWVRTKFQQRPPPGTRGSILFDRIRKEGDWIIDLVLQSSISEEDKIRAILFEAEWQVKMNHFWKIMGIRPHRPDPKTDEPSEEFLTLDDVRVPRLLKLGLSLQEIERARSKSR